MKNKGKRIIQKNATQIIEVIIAVITIIVISIGIKAMVKAGEIEETNNKATEEEKGVTSSIENATPKKEESAMPNRKETETPENIGNTTPKVEESEKPTQKPETTESAKESTTPATTPSKTPAPSVDASSTPNNTPSTTPSIDASKTPTPIFSRKYKIEDKTISLVEIKTPKKEFLQNIEIGEGQTAKIYKGETETTQEYIGTGMKVVVSEIGRAHV